MADPGALAVLLQAEQQALADVRFRLVVLAHLLPVAAAHDVERATADVAASVSALADVTRTRAAADPRPLRAVAASADAAWRAVLERHRADLTAALVEVADQVRLCVRLAGAGHRSVVRLLDTVASRSTGGPARAVGGYDATGAASADGLLPGPREVARL